MSSYQWPPSQGSSGGSGTLKSQKFTTSGTFTPSAALIAKGGSVKAFVVGGGAAGMATYSSAGGWSVGGSGGQGGEVLEEVLTILSPVTVSIGAGGTPASVNGGSTSVGALITASGGGTGPLIGSGAGGLGFAVDGSTIAYDSSTGSPGYKGYGGGGGGGSSSSITPRQFMPINGSSGGGYGAVFTVGGNAKPNSGGGGGGGSFSPNLTASYNGGNGGSGVVILEWWE